MLSGTFPPELTVRSRTIFCAAGTSIQNTIAIRAGLGRFVQEAATTKRTCGTVTPVTPTCTTAIGSAAGPRPACEFTAQSVFTTPSSSECLPKGRYYHEAPATLEPESQP